jgi:N-acetylmuramate 1-kinase
MSVTTRNTKAEQAKLEEAQVFHALKETLRACTGMKASALEAMPVHASNRRYYRAKLRGGGSVVLMKLSSSPTKAEEFTDNSLRIDELPFLEVQRRLASAGLPVPRVEGQDLDAGVIVLEDLGDLTLEDYLNDYEAEDFEDYYLEAVRLVTEMQRQADVIADDSIIERRRFNDRALFLELDHFREYGIEHGLGLRLSPRERSRFDEAAHAIVDRIITLPQTVVHRDFQSRNLMLRDGRRDGSLAIIDFQDALIGPYVYDLVALLRDSYVVLERPFVSRMLQQYRQLMPEAPVDLEPDFDLCTIQRKLKDAGRFVYIKEVKGNPSFMRFFQPSLRYGLDALAHLGGFSELHELASRSLEVAT